IWLRSEGHYQVDYKARVEVRRLLAEISTLGRLEPHDLPGEAVQYLFDSRYCPADRFQPFVEAEFGHLSGGARLIELREWVPENYSYVPVSSDTSPTAADSFIGRRGICRDCAHVMITLARASAVPARFVSCYAPGVTPQDFHAVAEVFLADDTVP